MFNNLLFLCPPVLLVLSLCVCWYTEGCVIMFGSCSFNSGFSLCSLDGIIPFDTSSNLFFSSVSWNILLISSSKYFNSYMVLLNDAVSILICIPQCRETGSSHLNFINTVSFSSLTMLRLRFNVTYSLSHMHFYNLFLLIHGPFLYCFFTCAYSCLKGRHFRY